MKWGMGKKGSSFTAATLDASESDVKVDDPSVEEEVQ